MRGSHAALRKLERRRETAGGRLDHVCQSLDRLLAEISEAERAIAEAQRSFIFDPKELEKSEERLFALRAAARKYKCTVDTLAEVRARFDNELKALTDGGGRLKKLEQEFKAAREAYDVAAEKLSNKRRKTARALDKAVMAELPPLKLERARFETAIEDRCRASRRHRHRPDRIHGGRQSGHAAGAADEGGFRR